jgi:hypothetical protein
MCLTPVLNHQQIINRFSGIINMVEAHEVAMVHMSRLPGIGESSTNRQHVFPNRKPADRCFAGINSPPRTPVASSDYLPMFSGYEPVGLFFEESSPAHE